MRYLTIILLFVCVSAYGQCTKFVNGVQVPCTQEEIRERQQLDSTFVADSSTNNKRTRLENKITGRIDKLSRAMIVAGLKLSDANYATFVSQTRNERNDYPYSPDALITWLTVTFPQRAWYDAGLQTRLLNILQ